MQVAGGGVEGNRRRPRQDEPAQEQSGAQRLVPPAPEQRDSQPDAQHRRLVLEQRGDSDADAAEQVEAGPILFGAHGAEKRQRAPS